MESVWTRKGSSPRGALRCYGAGAGPGADGRGGREKTGWPLRRERRRGARKEVGEQGRPKGPWGGAADRAIGSCALLRGTSKDVSTPSLSGWHLPPAGTPVTHARS